MNIASPRYTGPPASGLTGSLKTCSRDTPTSSSAQPVTGTDPLKPLAPWTGVSIVPKGGFEVPAAMMETRTETVGEPCAPLAVTVTVPVSVPLAGRVEASTPIVNRPLPVPAPSTICIHGWSAVAFQEIAPVPLCVSRTV